MNDTPKTTIKPETNSIIQFLNEVAALDPAFFSALMSIRLICNDAIINHPSIQTVGNKCGVLGLLNGAGPITAVVEADGTYSLFRRTEESWD